jgi:AAA+ superfamily predicted ATPase
MGVKAAPLSELEIARRLPVWCAMSDAFLDTELDAHNYRHMADVVRAQGFTIAEAEAIFRSEVAPAFAANLLSVAGEWAGWSEQTVRAHVLATMNQPFAGLVPRVMLNRVLGAEWAQISAHLDGAN